jgi:ABC-type Mn2+/Zn2+ transport system ATPase subunit
MSEIAIELKKVSLTKGKRRILDDVSLMVSGGEFFGILGPNGAGKTSLLNVIAGFEPFSGELRVFGTVMGKNRNRESRLRIGYVPQIFDIDPSFPIRAIEAVMTGGYGRLGLFRKPDRKEREQALEIMRNMRVENLAWKPLGHLSGGERQKVSLARALYQEPEILLLDEPTSGLDIAIQKEFLDLICGIHANKKITVVIVTHDFNMLPERMARAVLIRAGKVIFDGGTESALTEKALTDLFNYPVKTIERGGKRFISYG